MLPSGSSLGPYRDLQPIGSGGMGHVYRAHDPRLARDVALKTLQVDDNERRSRFEREARAVAALNHPNIVTVYSVEEADGIPFLTMELLGGRALSDLIPRGGLPLERVLEIAIPLTNGLAVAHDKGIVHRDLKPSNVMFGGDGTVKILDFGLAKLDDQRPQGSDETATMMRTGQGWIVGTTAYLSPEQAEGGTVDRRSDIFSFGVMLYEMATGERPFKGSTPVSVLAAVLRDAPAPMKELRADLPRELERIVRRCLAKNPERRYQDARDLRNDLEELSEARAAGALDTPASRDAGPLRTASRRWERLAWALALLAMAGLGGWQVLRRPAAASAPLVRLAMASDPDNPPTGYSVAVSPDGTRIAYVAMGSSGRLAWLRLLSESSGRPLPGTEGADELFWSPDGGSVGFFTPTQLKRIDLASGTVRTLADIPSATGGTWSSRGAILFAESGDGGLRRVAATGGAVETVRRLNPPDQMRFQWPWFLPDGTHYLYAVVSADPAKAGTYIASLDSSEQHRLLETVSNVAYASGSLFYIHGDALVAQPLDQDRWTLTGEPVTIAEDVRHNNASLQYEFSASTTGVVAYRSGARLGSQLTWLDRSGRRLGTLGPIGDYLNPEISPDGAHAAVERSGMNGNRDIWIVELAREDFRRFTFDPAMHYMPVWSPDGRRIAYAANPDRHFRVYSKPASGAGAPELLYDATEDAAPYDWSRDGRTLLYRTVLPNGVVSLGALSMSGSRQTLPIPPSAFSHATARLAPDARWVAYFTNESGAFEIYVEGFPDPRTGKWQVSRGGGLHPRWRSDGRELYYISPTQTMMAVEVFRDGETITFGQPTALFNVSLASGAGGVTIGLRQQYDVSADGKRFLVNLEASASPAAISVILNWPALATRTGAQ